MERPVRAGKKRRSKQLSVRNIQIAATVEVGGLHLGVLRQTRADGQLGLISGRTGNADAAAGVKYVDDHLLQALIAVGLRCVQRIERVKQRGERRSKQGVWEGDFAERDVRRSKIARVLPPIEILV